MKLAAPTSLNLVEEGGHPPFSLALLTDFYQLTMAYAYWKKGVSEKESVFHLFFRSVPFQGGFTMAAGLDAVINYLTHFKFERSDLDYLASLQGGEERPFFDEAFLSYLETLRFTIDLDAVPEGSIVFPYEPLIRVQGPLLQAQLLESPLLNLVNFPTLIATKAARVCLAARGDPVLEFGMRRAQGIDGALTASRAAYIGGCSATSHLLAGKVWGIPVRGTHAHSWVMSFDNELDSFYAYAEAIPDQCLLLVDTYNTLKGIERAIEVGKWLKKRGRNLFGVRLDSGDLASLSIQGRKMLDEAGFKEAHLVASGDLDEYKIGHLKTLGAKISVWGVGTSLVTAKDQPALDGVYKMSAARGSQGAWEYKMKLSEKMQKISNPGILQVKRYFSQDKAVADLIYDVGTDLSKKAVLVDLFDPTKKITIPSHDKVKDLLEPIFRQGCLVYKTPGLLEVRENAQRELASFDDSVKQLLPTQSYLVGMEEKLSELKVEMVHQLDPTSKFGV